MQMARSLFAIFKLCPGKIDNCLVYNMHRESTSILKDSAATKSKSYTCLVKLSRPVSIIKIQQFSGTENIPVKQRNPTRVPRRADLVRDKMIEKISVRPETESDALETDLIRVHVKTSAGTYVKEFVHGDDGRTVPCLATLLDVDSAACLELDVLEVHLDWPRSLLRKSIE